MTRVRKYMQGMVRVETADEIIHARDAKTYLWWRGKPYHPSWIANWSLHVIYIELRSGRLFYAHLTPEWVAKEIKR